LVVVNKPELGKVIVDRMLDKAPGGLSSNEPFKAAWGLRPEFDGEQQRAAWAYVDVAMLREAGVAKGLFREPKNSFGAELILGGVLAILRQTSTATADLSMSRQDVALRLAKRGGWASHATFSSGSRIRTIRRKVTPRR
jgi:hypothetical protein